MKINAQDSITDLTYLKQVSNGDNIFIKEMISVYLKETPVAIANLEKHLLNKDWKMLTQVIHKLKPSFSFFGVKGMQTTVDSIEEYSDNETHLDLLSEMIEHVKAVCEKAMRELEEVDKTLTF